MKYKVLIVDDEFRIGQLIKKLIKWDADNLECVEVVDNGEKAFQIIQETHPHIVITDIRMPKINGLDLICMTKEKLEDIRFVVISGYKEFEYAHRALQYGVSDYLLKPIDEKELNEVLHKIVGELNQEQRVETEKKKIEKTLSTSEYIIRENVLNSILDTEESVSLDDIHTNYNIDFDAEVYRGIDIKLDYWDYEKRDERQDKITIDKVVSIVEEHLGIMVKEQLICQKSNLHIYCLLSYQEDKNREIKNSINNVLSAIQEYLIRFEQYEVTIGIGPEEREFGNIRLSVQDAYRAVQNRIKLGTGRLIYADNIKVKKIVDVDTVIEMHKEIFIQSIETYNGSLLGQGINQIFGTIQTKDDIDYTTFYYLADKIVSTFFNAIDVENKEGKELRHFLESTSQHCYTVSKLKELLKQYLGEYLDSCKYTVENESVKPIREAKKYIENHYQDKIVLEDIASLVELNPVYFSVLFKKETGMNFSAYLTNVRMEVAKELIRNGNQTIAAIAEEVGYKDTRYFSQTFTKIVGVKPALYRKLHS